MSNVKTYKLSNMRQLIDLNGDLTNFDLRFNAKSKNKANFYALIVDQTTLDSSPELEYKQAEGEISGNLISDKNVYQNYFLVLKSDKPCDCEVIIDIKQIEPKLDNEPLQQIPQEPSKPQSTSSKMNWKVIIVAVLVVCGLFYLYKVYFNGEFSVDIVEEGVGTGSNVFSGKTIESIPDFSGGSVSLGSGGVTKSLIDRLNEF